MVVGRDIHNRDSHGVFYAIIRTGFSSTYRKGIWWSRTGTIMVVIVLFWLAGYSGTSYLPSVTDIQSSLTLANSSSSPVHAHRNDMGIHTRPLRNSIHSMRYGTRWIKPAHRSRT